MGAINGKAGKAAALPKFSETLTHGRTADVLCYVLPPKKNGDLFVLNSYKDKLYIKILGFSKESD